MREEESQPGEVWHCLARPASHLRPGSRVVFGDGEMDSRGRSLPVKEGETTDSLVWYNSTDSIDFTKTKEKAIRVYAQDASAYADYKVKVNVHTQRPDTFIWQSLIFHFQEY